MVVRNDDFHSFFVSILDYFYIAGSAIDRDYEFHILFCEFVYEVLLEPVAVVDTMGESVGYLYPDGREKTHQKSRGAHSIDIVISEYHDTLFVIACFDKSVNRQVHAIHKIRIMEVLESRVKEFFFLDFTEIFDSSVREKFCHKRLVRFTDDFEDVTAEGLHGLEVYK